MSTNDSLKEYLSQLGLTETEQKLYLFGLQKPEMSVNEVVSGVRINRTTAYHALDTLKQKGFTRETKVQGRLAYRMSRPDELENLLNVRRARIDSQRQQLRELSHLFPLGDAEDESVLIEKFEGLEGIKQAIEKALYCRSREWCIIAPRHNFLVEAGKDYSAYFMRTRKERGIKSRTLWEPDPDRKNSPNLTLEQLMMRKPRYLSPEFRGRFTSIVILFDDKALFVPPLSNQSAILISSEAVTGTLKVLFDALWQLADRPKS